MQGLRERWLADPRFLQRLAIEESISITTTLLAQYQRRGDRFWQEIEYVITDSVRGAVVDFFTVWLPAPTLSFRSMDSQVCHNHNNISFFAISNHNTPTSNSTFYIQNGVCRLVLLGLVENYIQLQEHFSFLDL